MKQLPCQRLLVVAGLTALLIGIGPVPASADPPENSGIVARWQFETAADWIVDGKTLIVGFDPVAFCQGNRDVQTSVWPFEVDPLPDCDWFDGSFEPLASGKSRVVLGDDDYDTLKCTEAMRLN